jgi:hypothetical protein
MLELYQEPNRARTTPLPNEVFRPDPANAFPCLRSPRLSADSRQGACHKVLIRGERVSIQAAGIEALAGRTKKLALPTHKSGTERVRHGAIW